MPEKLDRCVQHVKGQKGVDNAWAICNAQLSEAGECPEKHKHEKSVEEIMDQSPSMTNLTPSPQNTAGWPTSMNPGFGNTMPQMRENGAPCDICGGPEHPPMDHPYLPRMPNDPMSMTHQPMPQQSMPQMPMQPQMQPPMQAHPAQEEGGMGSGRIPTGGGDGNGSFGHGMGGAMGGGMRPQPGPVVSFETVSIPSGLSAQSVGAKKMNETIMKQILDKKVGCRCQKILTNKKSV